LPPNDFLPIVILLTQHAQNFPKFVSPDFDNKAVKPKRTSAAAEK
jgi:hypothetical protein